MYAYIVFRHGGVPLGLFLTILQDSSMHCSCERKVGFIQHLGVGMATKAILYATT